MPVKKAASSEASTKIELPSLQIITMDVTVIGDTPLIVHAWSEKAKRDMLDKQMGVAKGSRDKKDPLQDFESSMYRLSDDSYGFPSVAFKASAVTAVTSISNITKVAARQAFHVIGEPIHVKRIFDGGLMRTNLVRIRGSEPEMREDMVRVGMGTADIRYRAQFWPWYATVSVRFNKNVLTPAQIFNLFNTAGFAVGIGEWRPDKDGESGSFHVADAKEQKLIDRGQFRRLFLAEAAE
jgi:hypothetical protein